MSARNLVRYPEEEKKELLAVSIPHSSRIILACHAIFPLQCSLERIGEGEKSEDCVTT